MPQNNNEIIIFEIVPGFAADLSRALEINDILESIVRSLCAHAPSILRSAAPAGNSTLITDASARQDGVLVRGMSLAEVRELTVNCEVRPSSVSLECSGGRNRGTRQHDFCMVWRGSATPRNSKETYNLIIVPQGTESTVVVRRGSRHIKALLRRVVPQRMDKYQANVAGVIRSLPSEAGRDPPLHSNSNSNSAFAVTYRPASENQEPQGRLVQYGGGGSIYSSGTAYGGGKTVIAGGSDIAFARTGDTTYTSGGRTYIGGGTSYIGGGTTYIAGGATYIGGGNIFSSRDAANVIQLESASNIGGGAGYNGSEKISAAGGHSQHDTVGSGYKGEIKRFTGDGATRDLAGSSTGNGARQIAYSASSIAGGTADIQTSASYACVDDSRSNFVGSAPSPAIGFSNSSGSGKTSVVQNSESAAALRSHADRSQGTIDEEISYTSYTGVATTSDSGRNPDGGVTPYTGSSISASGDGRSKAFGSNTKYSGGDTRYTASGNTINAARDLNYASRATSSTASGGTRTMNTAGGPSSNSRSTLYSTSGGTTDDSSTAPRGARTVAGGGADSTGSDLVYAGKSQNTFRKTYATASTESAAGTGGKNFTSSSTAYLSGNIDHAGVATSGGSTAFSAAGTDSTSGSTTYTGGSTTYNAAGSDIAAGDTRGGIRNRDTARSTNYTGGGIDYATGNMTYTPASAGGTDIYEGSTTYTTYAVTGGGTDSSAGGAVDTQGSTTFAAFAGGRAKHRVGGTDSNAGYTTGSISYSEFAGGTDFFASGTYSNAGGQ